MIDCLTGEHEKGPEWGLFRFGLPISAGQFREQRFNDIEPLVQNLVADGDRHQKPDGVAIETTG